MSKEKDANDILKAKGKIDIVELDLETEHLNGSNVHFISEETKHLTRMNENHIFINSLGGKPMVMSKIYSSVFKREIYEYTDTSAIKVRYSNEWMPHHRNPELAQSLGQWWIEDNRRNEVETVLFEPGEPTGKFNSSNGKAYFNAWEGFACEARKGFWRRTQRHIYRILCNSDKVKFKYFIRWLAWAAQNPGERAEVCCVFKGKQGAGKGFIFTQMVELFGRHGMSMSSSEHLTGKHNAHLMLTSFLFADEAYVPGDKKVEGVLKQLITEPRLTVEPKFQNTRLETNCLHIGMSTNNDWVIAAKDDERRYFVNKVEDRYAKRQVPDSVRKEYFGELWGEMNKGGREAMLYDLLRINVKGWHPRDDVPDTDELLSQRFMTLPKRTKAILTMMENGIFPGEKTKNGEYRISSTGLQEYFNQQNSRDRINIRWLADTLKLLGVTFHRNDDKRFMVFPSLTSMKHAWNRGIIDYKWEDYDDWTIGRSLDKTRDY